MDLAVCKIFFLFLLCLFWTHNLLQLQKSSVKVLCFHFIEFAVSVVNWQLKYFCRSSACRHYRCALSVCSCGGSHHWSNRHKWQCPSSVAVIIYSHSWWADACWIPSCHAGSYWPWYWQKCMADVHRNWRHWLAIFLRRLYLCYGSWSYSH